MDPGVYLQTFCNSFTKIEQPVRNHLKNVYACLTSATLVAAAGAFVHIYTDFLQAGLLSALAGIGLLIWLASTPDDGKNRSTRLSLLMGFAFCTGLGLGPILEIVMDIDPSIIPTALIGTGVVFACFSGAALVAEQGKYLYLGGTLMSLMSVMLISSLVNIFIGSSMLSQAHLYLGLFVMCGFVLYDTQLIMEKRRRGDKDYIWHSVDLFIDMVGVFRRLLILLAQKEQSKKKRRD